MMSTSHAKFECISAGLVINPLYPHLGASPDGFTQCECCGKGVLEIKCPFSSKDLHPDAMKNMRGSFLTSRGLNHGHKYFTQAQGQLAISNREFCDFVVWTPKGLIIERIYQDFKFWEELEKKLTTYFVENILPEIMTSKSKMSLEAADDQQVYCVCKGACQGRRMIACDNAFCKYKWFHYQCVGIKRAPKEPWYCKSCSE